MPTRRAAVKARPLAQSLSRCKSILGIAAALGFAIQHNASAASSTWEGVTGGTPGDGFLWTDPLNWSGDVIPTSLDDAIFGSGPAGVVQLGTDQAINGVTFNANFTIGAYGTNQVLTNTQTTGNISVTSGTFATINAAYGGANGLTLSGGGTLYLTNPLSTFGGNITVDGPGTSLLNRAEGPTPQYNGMGSSQEFGRFDPLSLGFTTAVRTITIQNGGEYKIINAGNNPEGNFKNIVIGTGGGTLNLGAGYILQNLDDTGQITATTNAFTLAGKGRLSITGTMATVNPLGGVVNINGGMLSLDNQASQTVGANAYVRFLGIAGLGTTLNINGGGTLMINNGTQATLDTPTINANDGSTIAVNSADHIFGYSVAGGASSVTNLNISGTVNFLTRDLFAPQTQRFPRMRAVLNGTGVLNLIPNTNAGGGPRLVIERGVGSTFSGTFRLNENESLESNPRNNATVDTGKTIADGDVEFAGWGSTLDLRDSTATTSVFDYTTNEISITTTQNGALNVISPGRATAATGTGSMFNFGTLTMGNHRLVIAGNNSYQSGFADTASIKGDAILVMNSDNGFAVFSNSAAISEDAAGRSLTIIKTGAGNAAARDVIAGGAISVSNVNVSLGTLQLRGASGAITTGFGGAAPTINVNGGANNFTNGLPTQGLLHLDSNGGHTVGTTTVITAGSNNNRIDDSATLNLLSNSILRLTSASGVGTTETIGNTNISGHGTIDIVKTGAPASPVAITLNTLTLGSRATANFTGTSLGVAGANTSRIVIPGTATGFLSAQYHSGNEWAKYDSAPDNGFALGVTPFVAADYTIDATATDAGWLPGQQLKLTSATGTVMSASRNVDRVNLQLGAANQSVNLAGSVLTLDQGGLLVSGQTTGIVDGTTGTTPSGTAGLTSSTGQLYVYTNSQLDIRTPITGAIDFVKSGPGNLRLIHQNLNVGTGTSATAPFTATPWSSTLTGNWVINDGRLDVHRGEFLGGRPVILNGGHLEINQPVANANADGIIPGWGNNIIVNANASVVSDDNGESDDANGGDRVLVKLGSLTVNNGAILSVGQFSDSDIAYMGGTTFNGTPTITSVRGNANTANILNGVVAGSGFNMANFAGGTGTVVLGGTQTDTANNTYNGTVTIYAGTLRLNKANGSIAITDGSASEDVIINGGSLLWGPGHHGDLTATNNLNTTNLGFVGIVPNSPAAIKAAGMNQIADTATITLLTGTLGESDRITNEKWGTLIMKNGTVNVGLGTMEMDNAIISGGALGFDRGGTLKIGNASFLPGAFDMNVFTGRPTAGAYTTFEVGAGGISLTGQNINLGTAFSGNVAGAGGRLRLGGNLTYVGSDLIGGSYGRKGIYVQTGSTFRELGASHIDLMGGVRDFNIATDAIYTVTPRIINGGISKSGNGALVLEPYEPSSFAGPITVNAGVLQAKGDGAFGTSAGGVTVNNGGTVKLDSGWTYGDNFTVSGPGALIPGGGLAREAGALIAESGTNRLNGAFTLAGNATVAGNTFVDPSVTPGTGGAPYRIGTLLIAGAGGVTGTGTLTLSGPGDGVILNGVNTASGGLNKDGAGRWTLAGASTYTGPTTVTAGPLLVTNSAALGSSAAGTSVYGGSLEISGGISLAEPLALNGSGSSIQSGAVVSAAGANTLTGAITMAGNATLRVNSGSLAISNGVTGTGDVLTLSGAGTGSVSGAISTGVVGGSGLVKNGTGTWTLSGANNLLGSTTVNGGTLTLNYTTANNAKVNVAEPIVLGGGSLNVVGNAGAATLQAVNGLNVNAGGGTVSVAGGAAGATLNVGAINRASGATVNFSLGANGNVATSAPLSNGIIGAFATVNGANWATTSGGNVAALSSYSTLATTGADTNNSILTTTQSLAGSVTTNSLKIASGSGLGLGANNLLLSSGGLLSTSNAALIGTGTLSGSTSANELIVYTGTGSTLDVGVPIIGAGAGGLTKAGNGTLFLSSTANAFTGPINVNGGTLAVTASAALGSVASPRDINLNGGTFAVVGTDYDLVANTVQLVVGPGGGTVRSVLGSQITINDGTTTGLTPTQLRGSGDLTFTGGGRYTLSGGTPQFQGFTGNVTVENGILTVGHSNSLGGRQEQTITLKTGSAIINNTGFGLGQNGLPNNIVAESGVEFFALGGSRGYGGDIQLTGTSTIALLERDNPSAERQIHFNGRVSGTGITLNVFGVNNGNPFYLGSGSNPITGTINLNANAVLETRVPGSLGLNTGDVTVNLNGANSRLLLRHFQNGDYRANVVVNDHAEINADRLVNFGGGGLQILSVNNLTLNGDGKIVTIAGGNNYHTRVGGTATFNAPTNTILNVTSSDLILENGITFGTPGSTLDKRGGFTAILRGPTNHTGALVIQGGLVHLQDNGTLAGTSLIDLRGGELRVDNSAVINTNRLNDAASINLGGGVLRITGEETLGTVTAIGGTTQVISNPINETVPTPLTLTGFTRAVGAVVQFQAPDVGAAALAVGQNTVGQTRVGSRIFIPGQANTTQTIPGFLGNNNLDFVQYDGATMDSGFALGVRDMRNPTSTTSPSNYTNDAAETAWNDTVILRTGTASTTINLTANRALDAWKIENTVTTLNQGAFDLRIEGGGILATSANPVINGTGRLYAGAATATAGVAELFIGGNNTLTVNSIISDNPLSGQTTALVKTGSAATLALSGANTYSGGTYVTAGTLNVLTNTALGAANNPVTLSGGTLLFNIPNASSAVALGGLGQNISVTANSQITLDNGALAGTDNDIALGSLTINGPYTLRLFSFDSMDASFTGTHTFAGTPTIDMTQAGSGGNQTGFFTLNGAITGSGFFVGSSGATNDTTSVLQIGGGEATPNTYTGKVTVLLGVGSTGSNSEDLTVQLNKAAGTAAITGDLEINGGTVRNLADNQIADTSNLVINQGQYDANGKNETIASVTMRGGNFRSSSGATGNNTVTVTGNFDITGADDLTGSPDGIAANSNSTINILGTLKMNGYAKGTIGGTASTMILGGLEMTGTTLTEGGAGSLVRLNGDVTTFASSNVARLGATTTVGAQVQLNGARVFNVADGSAALDLAVSTALTDSTSPVAAGSLIKNGPGTMQLEGAGTVNAYTGTTTINEGAVVLFKNTGVNAIPAGALTIGDGTGGAKADKVILRNSNQIADANNLTIASSGVLDLDTFNTSETVASLAGSGNVDLGPGSVFGVSGTTSTTYSGSIIGGGSFTKAGASVLNLTGINDVLGGTAVNGGTLLVNGVVGGSVTVAAGASLGGDGSILGPVTINGGTLSPGNSPGSLDTGALSLASGTLLAELTSRTSYDSLNVTGSVALGGTLTLNIGAGPFQALDVLSLIVNDGVDAVTGTFSGLPEGSLVATGGGFDFFISYAGNVDGGGAPNDVILFTVPEPGSAALLLGGLGSLLAARRRRRA